jgi:hypothetical protein
MGLFENKIVKRFAQYLVFTQSPEGRHPIDKYSVKASHRSQFV